MLLSAAKQLGNGTMFFVQPEELPRIKPTKHQDRAEDATKAIGASSSPSVCAFLTLRTSASSALLT